MSERLKINTIRNDRLAQVYKSEVGECVRLGSFHGRNTKMRADALFTKRFSFRGTLPERRNEGI